ncbi:MAG: histidine phosphatase family protein [Saprospiraceae bacterium]|nr:histidine phosphatase family protein [Saprospiraceae bacterium]
MKKLFLIRHAKSSWDDPEFQDIDRPLSSRGLRDAPQMAVLLKGMGIHPDRLVSSPANRAFTTASFFAAAFGIPASDIAVDDNIYEAMPQDIVRIVHQIDDRYDTVLLFGHNPTLTSVANMFAESYIPNVPTCGIVGAQAEVAHWKEFNQSTGRLIGFYFPKQHLQE